MTDHLAAGMAQLTTLLADRAILDRPSGIADIVSGMLPGSPLVGVALTGDETVAGGSADARAFVAAELPYHDQPGPYRAAAESAAVVSVPDTAAEPRWPEYAQRMRRGGIAAHDVWPLCADGDVIGTLSVYRRGSGGVDEPTRSAAAMVADHLGVLLRIATETARRTALTEQLRAALDSRSVIDQAVGILMGQQRCDRDTAFGMLRAISNRRNVKLATVAAELVAAIGGSPPATPHFDEPTLPTKPAGRSR
ncbi:GAF and ANTAR domain-containing protein [Nocardia sp. BMG51109]|uniref:GAF and ANTAR domain-containing protein n=1 Tax=Nocardia sp. BMG51109 TaxID=1056816 RepID=UPI0004BC517A|nr:GAF and ANTAR domain-containing protein [Nocardia sp. BMG51109]